MHAEKRYLVNTLVVEEHKAREDFCTKLGLNRSLHHGVCYLDCLL